MNSVIELAVPTTAARVMAKESELAAMPDARPSPYDSNPGNSREGQSPAALHGLVSAEPTNIRSFQSRGRFPRT